MKCPNCKREYKDNIFSCPYCGAINKEIYKDIKEVDLKKSSYASFKDDVRNKKFNFKKEIPLLIISIIIILLAYFLSYYYFTYIEDNLFLFKIITNYPLWLIIFIPLALFIYYKNFSLLSLILNLYFSIFIGVSICFSFFLPVALTNNGHRIFLSLLLIPIVIFIVFAMLKFVITTIKNKLLNHHAISYLVFMISTLYLLVTMITIIIRITCY